MISHENTPRSSNVYQITIDNIYNIYIYNIHISIYISFTYYIYIYIISLMSPTLLFKTCDISDGLRWRLSLQMRRGDSGNVSWEPREKGFVSRGKMFFVFFFGGGG